MTDITAIVLTHNETLHIGRCIDRLQRWCAKIIVLDSFSEDNTVAIARAAGAEVHSRAFINQAEQFQWALDTIPIATEWIIRVDADEYFEPALVAEIKERLPTLDARTTGVMFRRKMIFRGRWIRWGTYYPVFLLRLFRTGAARVEQRWMDEHLQLTHGDAILFVRGDFVDENLQTIGAWTDKHNRYATRHMVDFVGRRIGLIPTEPMPADRKARTKRWLREKVFGRTPLYLRSWLYFNYRFFVRLGFLDGCQGFVWHFLHGFWFFMLIDAKIDEAERQIAAHGEESLPQWLAERYGFTELLPGRPK
ncbi:glycosyltransferase family 2 protein [Sphingomonas asaccharolytica]|uniref:glycosyltransferase family 2 protein n=1 Tax=Sphingomonas asaccharolytica TaxID=40681 RepID=UPI000B147923|nr:glycosyltransferase family 2 protein [Sphingomonas asaccharolytica]